MNKFFSLIGRLLLAQIYLVSIIIQLMLIFKNPDGYSAYQDFLAQHGLGTIFAPIMILVQLVAGSLLFLGFKTRGAAITLAIYSIFVAVILKFNEPIVFMQYMAIAGGMIILAVNPKTAFSLDNLKK
ncbi:DoxX family protein [Methylovorus sp. MP688]|uniref:DoxX family protein n=1 Tax=Methylovorus sp. (strain MP688) TaxID=887061 RepID=UPI0001EC4F01|nr:DoxX family protein [Methylovorus sp. MP688]ADQ85685.1 DoxX family protein [Methylovorus sp. MP688]